MEAPWIDEYEVHEWKLYMLKMHSEEHKNLKNILTQSDLRLCSGESEETRKWWKRNGSIDGLFFFDVEQLLGMDLSKVYGPSDLEILTKEWRGHPVGSLVFTFYHGVTEIPPEISVAIAT